MTYNDLLKHLFSIKNPKFADFSKTLSNSNYKVIGVKNPELRTIIKEHKSDTELKPEDFVLGEYLEVDFIYFGLSLSRLKTTDEQLRFLKDKIHLAKSWAITDCVATFVKKTTFEQFWLFFVNTNNSKHTYERRMAYILALKQYRDKRILDVLSYIKTNEEYMVMMAEAWLLSVIALSFEDEIFEYLSNSNDITLKRKTISKICDSFRFTNESKERFKMLRK